MTINVETCRSKSYVIICNKIINIVQSLVELYIMKMHGTGDKSGIVVFLGDM